MKIEQLKWSDMDGWEFRSQPKLSNSAQLVFLFGGTSILKNEKHITKISQAYGNAYLFGCSTAGEICSTNVSDNSLVITAVEFEQTPIQVERIKIEDADKSYQAGEYLAQSLKKEGLAHVFVLSDGLKVNGSELVKGLSKHLPENITVTGGLSGDGANFRETLVFWNGKAERDTITILGLYGEHIKVGYASMGGWDSFGPERLITKANKNVLYEMDGKSALELYKRYLGENAKGLPATGLLFPLSVRAKQGMTPVVRTILSVNEAEQSLTFAGDVPEGAYAQLMKANFDRLIEGSSEAAKISHAVCGCDSPDLAILISCVGRKMVLNQRIEEEVEAVRDQLGEQTVLTGFYSYGEISPFTQGAQCELHNQTMTITTFWER
jgi:hypothetical protein